MVFVETLFVKIAADLNFSFSPFTLSFVTFGPILSVRHDSHVKQNTEMIQ